jgi:hypothetical protein
MEVDRTVFLYNRSGSAIAFDEYRLVGDGNRFDPAGWTSIADAAAGGQSSVVLAALGPGALTFAETSAEPNHLAEGSASGFATLQPGAWIAIGKPLIDFPPWQGKQFFYHVVGEPTDVEGEIGFYHVPESTSWMMLLVGAAAAALAWPLARRRAGVARS